MLASADGSKVRPLLNDAARSTCPFTGRPAFSLDGRLVAVVCYDQALTSMGLWTVDLADRSLGKQLDSSSEVTGSATWTGDDAVVYEKISDSSEQTRLFSVPRNGGEATDITPDMPGSYSHPDWSENGLLVLVSSSAADVGRVASIDEDRALSFFGDEAPPGHRPGPPVPTGPSGSRPLPVAGPCCGRDPPGRGVLDRHSRAQRQARPAGLGHQMRLRARGRRALGDEGLDQRGLLLLGGVELDRLTVDGDSKGRGCRRCGWRDPSQARSMPKTFSSTSRVGLTLTARAPIAATSRPRVPGGAARPSRRQPVRPRGSPAVRVAGPW